MEDTVSQGSLDSATGEEYVVVNADPKLKIPGNGCIDDLEEKLSEVLKDDNMSGSKEREGIKNDDLTTSGDTITDESPDSTRGEGEIEMSKVEADDKGTELPSVGEGDIPRNIPTTEERKTIGDSTFFSCAVNRPRGATNMRDSEASNFGDPWRLRSASLPNTPDLPEGQYTFFSNVTYLGSASINAPRSEAEINRNMEILNEHSQLSIPITLAVPSNSEGLVRLLEPSTNSEIATFKVHRILFCARGAVETNERKCFAFTCSHGDSADAVLFQCHVFRCEIQDAVGKILYCFATSFRKIPRHSFSAGSLSSITEDSNFHFDVFMEVKEEDGKGNFSACPKDKNAFKLRVNLEKKISVTMQQTSNKELKIERCFGMLISPGRNVKHSDMHLLDMVHMGQGNDGKVYIISGNWDPKDSAFGILNTETPKDTRVFMTVAVDLVIAGIREPVRFVIETKAKIFPQNERFWYINKKPLQEKFHLKLKEVESTDGDEAAYEVVSIVSQTEKDRKKANLSLNISPTKNIPEDVKTPNGDESSDPDEPIMSGSGSVSKEITDEELLKAWGDTLKVWHQNLALRPKQVHQLCRKGIPEALRGEVWQLLAGCQDSKDMFEAFRILITKDSVSEDVIMRDINRTFPAHDYFRETGGLGQDALYKISKAYSVYDEEIGYCQGLSFLAAGLVLHMPEEQAFAVLVKIMFDYGLRDLFKNSFDDLHLKFYQLERLMQDQLSDLYEHFMELRLEAHMYASQWFLTLFTAKFPLFMVFHIMDVFLSEGMNTIFHVALALLKSNRKELLALDFEGILKYFRVQLPKKYRSEENARELLTTAVSWKISSKKLKKYEKEYMSIKEAQMQQEDPIERYERENKRLMEANMRLEQENDDLAHELVTSKIQLRSDLDASEDKADALAKELLSTKTDLVELEEEKKRLETESAQLKDMCRRELEKLDQESSRNNAIIAEYKQICTQLSERLEKQASASKIDLAKIKEVISGCDRCTKLANTDTQLKSMDTSMTISDGADPNQVLDATKQIRELELELAQTKLALVESECKTQDLTHQLNAALTELQASKNTWFQKTFNSIKEAAAKRDPKERDSKDHKEKERENKERKESMT